MQTFALHQSLRALDGDLTAVMRGGEVFEWQRINFILEAAKIPIL